MRAEQAYRMTKPIADAADAKVVRESLEKIQNEIQERINLGFFDAAHSIEPATERQAEKVAARLRTLGYVVLMGPDNREHGHTLNVSWHTPQPITAREFDRDPLNALTFAEKIAEERGGLENLAKAVMQRRTGNYYDG